ncbi:hypothetical protein MVEN_00246300 [Mycena venus]|uniref:C3H1-type domain-containing protein n=1 Tax=Mycena venus TaxID=2733690 RepID=A0A8H7DCC1_9AGAR|nr:hypothetical protein MVEN_00246300 [Mycena venus]
MPSADQRHSPDDRDEENEGRGGSNNLYHVTCKFYKLGGCTLGSSCPYSHNLSHIPCKFYRIRDCFAGSSCPFSHSLVDHERQNEVCAWFLEGKCKFGHRCALAHVLPGQSTVRTEQLDSRTSAPTDDAPETLSTGFATLSETGAGEISEQPTIQQLNRQYWNIRREISTLAVRGEAIERRLRNLSVKDPYIYLTSSELTRRLARVKAELADERNLSRKVEHILEDIRRECEMPIVTPLLLSAFVED